MSTGRISPQLNKYKISRRGRKLQISDDQRTLLALPKDVPERTWAEILQKEENDLVCFDIREEILEEALRIGYEHYMEKQTALFTSHCTAQAWLKLIDWHFYRHDPGEEPSAYPACFIPHRVESWTPDELPNPSPKDTWGKQELNIAEEMPDETLSRWPSTESVDYPVVDEIPREYWFPGRVAYQTSYGEEEGEEFSSEERRRRRRKPPVVRGAIGNSAIWDFIESYESIEISSSDGIVADSEILQKVTDYSQEVVVKESVTSALKTTTPVDGSLHGAGDSTVGMRQKRPSLKKTEKSKSFSRPSVVGRSKLLAPIDGGDSRSRISVISDCRLRNLRLETQHEVASEKVDSPQGESGLKRK